MAARNSTGGAKRATLASVDAATTTTEDRLLRLNRQLAQIRAIALAAEIASLDEESLNSIVEAIDDIADAMVADLAAVLDTCCKAPATGVPHHG